MTRQTHRASELPGIHVAFDQCLCLPTWLARQSRRNLENRQVCLSVFLDDETAYLDWRPVAHGGSCLLIWLGWKDYSARGRASPLRGRPPGVTSRNVSSRATTMRRFRRLTDTTRTLRALSFHLAINAKARQLAGFDVYGWGGRIRTSEWRDQNPLPYHLATPQHFKTQSSRPAPCTQ